MQNLSIHNEIRQKLDGFYASQRIPHLLFHGSPGTGKRTLVYEFIHKIYGGDKHKLKSNVMFVNCAHGKGIKFIRDELKFFAKTNIQGSQDIPFKTIVLFNAYSLTMDAQSALRRCIELFSYNTRFFIVVENKHKLLNPILSRFCEIYVPEYMDPAGHIQNLHQVKLAAVFGPAPDLSGWFEREVLEVLDKGQHGCPSHDQLVQVATKIYEAGYSCLDLMAWISETSAVSKTSEASGVSEASGPNCKSGLNRVGRWTDMEKADAILHFQNIKSEFRCEKLLLFTMLDVLFCKNLTKR